MEAHYRVDENKIVHEVLDQEAMLVNLDNGYYYALEGCAVDIWQTLAAGASVPETAQRLLQRYLVPPADAEEAVRKFVDELVAEELLVPAESDALTPGAMPAEPPDAAALPFNQPVMYKYTDMANLIQMDPIREFDESGWPKRRKL
jgi:hypothetical protein